MNLLYWLRTRLTGGRDCPRWTEADEARQTATVRAITRINETALAAEQAAELPIRSRSRKGPAS